ncbi:MAG: hypothetical protein WAL71_05160 [Terriglobales bacterium]|jgi:hypothetical protein
MTDNRTPDDRQKLTSEAPKGKKPYQKPAFRYERVFETAALACAKTFANIRQCGNQQSAS